MCNCPSVCDFSICHCQLGEDRLVHGKLLKITELASLIMNTAEKLKMQMVAAKHCCLHYLVVFSACGSREVRELLSVTLLLSL